MNILCGRDVTPDSDWHARTTLWLVPRRVAPVAQPGLRPVPGPQLHQVCTDRSGSTPHVGPQCAMLLSRSMNLLDVVEDLLQRRAVGHGLEDRCHAQIGVGGEVRHPAIGLRTSTTRITHPPVCRSPGTSCTSSPPAGVEGESPDLPAPGLPARLARSIRCLPYLGGRPRPLLAGCDHRRQRPQGRIARSRLITVTPAASTA